MIEVIMHRNGEERMGFVSKHIKRDQELPVYRKQLLENALSDLTNDKHVLAIYLGGSLAKGNADNYSDIDLHTIVTPETKAEFIRNKRKRASIWGEVLFYEESSPASPVVVTHYSCFVKIDSWYKTIDEVVPSIWLKGLTALYDPGNILTPKLLEASSFIYEPEKEDVAFWTGKVIAFLHETYRSVMRGEVYYALANLDRVRWLIADGWYMEMGEHLDSSYGVWSKVEGARSQLHDWQLSLLASWACSRDVQEIMKTVASLYPEILRLHKSLCMKVNITDDGRFKESIEMVL